MMGTNELFFNELSLNPHCEVDELHRRVLNYAEVLSRCGELGHKRIRYENDFAAIMLTPEKSLATYCYENIHNTEYNTSISLILSTRHHPYIDPDTEQEAMYVENDYKVIVGDSSVSAYGLTSAFLSNSFSVGFQSSDEWNRCCFPVSVMSDGSLSNVGKVFCVSDLTHFDDSSFVKWYVDGHEVAYVKRKDEPYRHLSSDHHGKDILMRFTDKIMKEDFVVGIVNSLPFESRATKFVETIGGDGIINLRLIGTDKGLGIAVQTTGKCKLQTTYFAKILEEKYSRY